ncbi:hypothetical protein [Cytobacillus praedii]|uniref:hypothetical protein n=1 Tax=Cytobacillus praedii TaxID=1742358 RepID=UPI003AF425A2
MNFLIEIDKEYAKAKNSDQHYKFYYHYLDINIKNSQSHNSFLCLKQDKVKFLIIEEIDNIKLYLSDADIIDIITKLEEKSFNILINSFFELYNENNAEFVFQINGQEYKTFGLKFDSKDKYVFNTQIETKADFPISFEDLINLLNLIFAKEIHSMNLFDPGFHRLKRQLAKYIALSNYYRDYNNNKFKHYLENIGYNIQKDNVFSVYNNEYKQKNIDEKFNITEVFENIIINDKIEVEES